MNARLVLGLLALGVAIWLVWAVTITNGIDPGIFPSEQYLKRAGPFGDAFGPISSLMSTFAFFGAVYSLYLQRRVSYRQSFEDHFFTLLQNLKDERSEIEVSLLVPLEKSNVKYKAEYSKMKTMMRDKKKSFIGRDAFSVSVYRIRQSVKPSSFKDSKFVAREDRKCVARVGKFRNYFRLFYHICRFVDKASIEDRDFYIQLLRAHLSDAEAILIAYNCAIDEGVGAFAEICQRFRMFHNLKTQNLDAHEKAELDFLMYRLGSQAFDFTPTPTLRY